MTLRECMAKYGKPRQQSQWRMIHAIEAMLLEWRNLYNIGPETYEIWKGTATSDVKPMTWEDLMRGIEAASRQ